MIIQSEDNIIACLLDGFGVIKYKSDLSAHLILFYYFNYLLFYGSSTTERKVMKRGCKNTI